MNKPSLSPQQVADLYFIEHRAKLLDVASFLDRAERGPKDANAAEDVRLATMKRAIALLIDGKAERARRVLELLSDPTEAPIDKAGTKGAIGVWPGARPENRG